MIPLAVPDLSGNEAKYLQECIETTFVSSVGPFVTRLEEMMKAIVGTDYAVATSSGTTGLHLALTAIGVQPGDLIILPSFTFIASANAVSHCGALPWLVDVTDESWTIDPELLESVLLKNTEKRENGLIHKPTGRRISAIMPVYTLGMPADMAKIRKIAEKYKLSIIADAAAAVGAEYHGNKLGELADISVFSFNGNKTVTAGGGGMLTGNNQELLDLARHLSTTARRGSDYDHDMVGFNYRMTNIQAAVGCAQLERLEHLVASKRRIDKTYRDKLRNINGISFFPSPAWAKSSCWFTGLVLENEKLPSVPVLCQYLRDKGIGARTFWKPIHLQKPYYSCPKTIMDVSERIWQKILTLPCSTHLTENEQRTVINTLTERLQ